jgi:hypothetical protein
MQAIRGSVIINKHYRLCLFLVIINYIITALLK